MIYYHGKTSDLKETNQQLDENLEELNSEYNQLKNSFESLEDNYEEKSETLAETKQDLKKKKENYQDLNQKYLEITEEHKSLEENFEETKENYRNLKKNHNELKNDYQSLENDYTALQTDYIKIQEQHSAKLDNTYRFEKLMIKGLRKISDGQANKGYAASDYDDASYYYKNNYFSEAEFYAKNADTYYSYATGNYEEAESLFKQAKKYAINQKQKNLAENYEMATDYGAKIYSEIHQANEYFASACNYYSQEEWSLGDSEIEEMNKHINKHDDLVPTYNEYLSNVNALLEDW